LVAEAFRKIRGQRATKKQRRILPSAGGLSVILFIKKKKTQTRKKKSAGCACLLNQKKNYRPPPPPRPFRASSPRQPPLEMHDMRSEKPVELQQQPHPPPLCYWQTLAMVRDLSVQSPFSSTAPIGDARHAQRETSRTTTTTAPPLCVIGKRLRWFAMNAFSST
jgi:hypothetical protein